MLPNQKYVCYSKEAQFQIDFLFGAMIYMIDSFIQLIFFEHRSCARDIPGAGEEMVNKADRFLTFFLVRHSDNKEVNKHVFQVVERAVKTNAEKEWYRKRPVLDGMVRKTLFEDMVFEQSPE